MADYDEVRFPPIDGMGIRIDLFTPIVFSGIEYWGADIRRRRLTASGREGKPENIIKVMLKKELGSPADLLRQVADLLDSGTAKVKRAESR